MALGASHQPRFIRSGAQRCTLASRVFHPPAMQVLMSARLALCSRQNVLPMPSSSPFTAAHREAHC
jgi:hypothetical protein